MYKYILAFLIIMGVSAFGQLFESGSNYLPLSGGTMTGTINQSTYPFLADTIIIGADTLVSENIPAHELRMIVHNASGVTLSKGTPVYISGATGDIPNIDSARADNAAMMPARGMVQADIANGGDGHIVVAGGIQKLNTTSYSVGDELYIGATGGVTTTKPTGTNLIQKIGEVTRINVNNGEIEIGGAGRTNDLPNIASANFWLGNGSGVPTAVTMSSDATMDNAGAVTVTDDSHNHIYSNIDQTTSANWAGQVSDETGTGLWTFATSPTFTTDIETPLVIGGTGTTSDLSLKTTSGVGATGADMHFLVGNDGGTEAMTILNDGRIGIGTNAPKSKVEVLSTLNALADLAVEENYHFKLRNPNNTDGEGIGISFGMSGTGSQQTAAIVSSRTGGNGQGDLRFYTKQSTSSGVAPALGLIIDQSGKVGIGTPTPNASLEVKGPNAGTVGGFPAGALQVTQTSATQFTPAVITGHNSYSGNTQLWYLGSMSSSNDDICFMNRQNGHLSFYTNNTERLVITNVGDVGIGTTVPPERFSVVGNIATGDTTTGDVDVFHYFSIDGSWVTEYFKWDDGNSRFELSDDLDITGGITATSHGGITEANLVDKSATEAITGAWDFGGATSLEIPNSDNPTTDANGELAVDNNANALEFYIPSESESGLKSFYDFRSVGIPLPDSVQAYIPDYKMFQVKDIIAPYGIEIDSVSIQLDADAAYSLVVEEWSGADPPVFQNTITTIATGGTDTHAIEAPDTDAAIDANDWIVLDLPTTDVPFLNVTIYYHVTEGN